ncbi:DUF6153 family protein [Isoptericola sp. BMS4]|uniref:DUF6153 family protein n=1 Tax=Isoptericola sp. BMS4 TaxID=2527875 RepID=UPI001420EC3E|nr:DUF6153 family protein [Isoptericola sp. BMS4]
MRTRPPLAAASPRSGLCGLPAVLLLAVLLLGVVTMHAMSGSASHHGAAHVVAAAQADGETVGHVVAGHVEPAGHPGHAEREGRAAHEGGPGAAAATDGVALGAMCLMVLVALLVLLPPRGVVLAVRRALARARSRRAPRPVRYRLAPDLRALGISRT